MIVDRDDGFRIEGESCRILPLITARGDRRVLLAWLRDRYDVVVVDDPHEGLRSESVDLCILDHRSFETHRNVLLDRKETERPKILPYLMVNRRDDLLSDPESQRYIDDVITTPISQQELTQRVEALLRMRRLSCALNRKNEKLQVVNDRLEYLLKTVAHDLRNPLSIAKGYAELIDDPAAEEIETALDRMEHLVENFLSLNRMGDERSEEGVELITFRPIIEECWEMVPTADASLELIFEENVFVRTIPHLLRRLIENLLRNAIEHGGDTVQIRIGILPNLDGFYIADDGAGIPEEKRIAVFEEGYSTSAGSGLGLMISKRIADTHGWKIRVTESERGGACFEIRDVEIDIPR